MADDGGETPQPEVLFVSLPAVMGGSIRSLVIVLDELAGRCRRVVATPRRSHLASVLSSAGPADEILWIGGHEQRRWHRVAVAAQLARWAWRHRGSLAAIHANGLAELNVAVPAAVLARRPLIVWSHDPMLSGWAARLVPILARAPRTTFAVVSEAAGALLVREGRVPRDRIRVVPNPIDPARVVAPERRATSDVVTVTYLGLAEERKGFAALPAIIGGLAGEPVEVHVHSDPTASTEVWDELRRIEDPVVRLHGLSDDVRDVYAASDIVLCPSRVESFGLVAVEAMLNGLPVVAADVPALHEVLGEAGRFFAQGDTAGAATLVRELVRDPAERRRLGALGRARAGEFEVAPVVAQLVDLYGVEATGSTVRRRA